MNSIFNFISFKRYCHLLFIFLISKDAEKIFAHQLAAYTFSCWECLFNSLASWYKAFYFIIMNENSLCILETSTVIHINIWLSNLFFIFLLYMGFLGGSDGKESAWNSGDPDGTVKITTPNTVFFWLYLYTPF